MSQPEVRSHTWPLSTRMKIALGIAVLEGILVGLSADFTRWTLIIVSAPIIAFYVFAGRTLESRLGRDLSWMAAAAQTFAVLLAILALVIKVFVLIIAGVFAAIALILLIGDRERPKRA